MISLFDKRLIALETEIQALKTARIKAAQTLNVGEYTQDISVTVSNWAVTKSVKITITPTSTTSPNILSSVTGGPSDYVFRILRNFTSDGKTIYYLTYLGHLDWEDDKQNDTIETTISVRYTAPANITVEYVNPIYGY